MMKKLLLIFIALISGGSFMFSQTSLNVGDIAITALETDKRDFAFVSFVDLDEGTIIYFTDSPANGNTIQLSPEGHLRYTVPIGGITAGTVVRRNATDFLPVTGTGFGTFSLSDRGDNLTAYQGPSVGNVDTYLHAVTDILARAGSFPAEFNAVLVLSNSGINFDDGQYNGTRSGETASTFFSQINDVNNWLLSNVGFDSLNLASFSITSSPGVTVSTTSLFDFFYFENNGPSIEQNFTVNGDNLSDEITITVPEFFEISLNDSNNYSSSVTIVPVDGSIEQAIIYVRLMNGLVQGGYNSTITINSTGTATKTVNLFGEIAERPPLTLQTIWSGPLATGLPNGIEVYVFEDIDDLSIYGLGSTNDGTGYFGQEFTFPSVSATAGQFITITDDQSKFQEFFGFSANYVSTVAAISGNDAVELLEFGDVIDSYGYVGANGAGTFWDYDDGWASRVQETGPDGDTFVPRNWSFSGTGVLTGAATNNEAVAPVPIGGFLISWTGNIDSDWLTAGNWSSGTVPTRTDNAYINVTSNPPVINSNVQINDIFLFDEVTINSGRLRVNGDVDGDSGSLRVESGASLLTYGTITGENHTVIRNTTFDEGTGQYSVIGTPVDTANTSILGSLVYGYDEDAPFGFDGTERYFRVENEPMEIGDAYFSAFTGTVTFTGTPNTGTYEIPIVYDVPRDSDVAGYNLVSNPYPGEIDFVEFIIDNIDVVEGEIYIWDDDNPQGTQGNNDDYLIVNAMGFAGSNGNSWNGFIGTAQGFFVKANVAGGNLTFENDQRYSDGGSFNGDDNFFRTRDNSTSAPSPLDNLQKIKLNVVKPSNGLYNSVLVGFLEDATKGDDHLYDALKLSGNSNLQLFTYIDEKKYAIQGLPYVTDERVVPLGLTVGTSGNYQFNLEEVVNLPSDISVYILDKSTGSYTEIKGDKPVNFSSDAVFEDNRFDLVFTTNSTLSLGENELNTNLMSVFASETSLTLKLNDGKTLPSAKISVSDILGRSIIKRNIIESFNTYELKHKFEKSNVYLLKVESELGTIVKKIIIK